MRSRNKNPHYLFPIVRKDKDFQICTFDIESKDGPGQERGFTRPFLLGFYDGRVYRSFRTKTRDSYDWKSRHIEKGGCVDRFMSFLVSSGSKYTSPRSAIFSHNGGRFDNLFLFNWVKRRRRDYLFEVTSAGERIISLRIKERWNKKREWEFRDSVAVMPIKLDEAAKKFCPDLPKLEWDQNKHEEDDGWRAYLKRDCLALHGCLTAMNDLIEGMGGALQITAPSCSMYLFRAGYQIEPIHTNLHWKACDGVCHGCPREGCDGRCHGCLHEFARLGYVGGRSEIFIHRAKRLRAYDRNSSYPASMLEPMPVGLAHEEFGGDLLELRKKHVGKVGLVECEVDIPEDCLLPPLPVRLGEKLVFPAGKLSGVWFDKELELLEEPSVSGTVTKVKRTVWYEARDDFREFMLSLYSLRDKTREDFNEGVSYFAKIFMNSFYGRWGMNTVRSELFLVDGVCPPESGVPVSHDQSIWQRERLVDSATVIPQIAGYITCLSRIALWRCMTRVTEYGGVVAYTDTDCIYTDLEFDNEYHLGGWKSEYTGTADGEFVLPKLYRTIFHTVECEDSSCTGCYLASHLADCENPRCSGCSYTSQKMKGIPKGMKSSDNFDLLVHRGGEIRFTRITQHKTILKEGADGPRVIHTGKRNRSTYEKRTKGRTAYDWTSPLVLEMWR